MPKLRLQEPYRTLENEVIDTLIAGHKEWRPDLNYPESHSDMQGAVRGLFRMFEVKRRPLPIELPIEMADFYKPNVKDKTILCQFCDNSVRSYFNNVPVCEDHHKELTKLPPTKGR